jgi:hypothetical protein
LEKVEKLRQMIKDGSYITIYLAPFDYHRIHFPMDGTIKRVKYFPGSLYSVNKSSLKTITSLYTKNERTLVHVQSNKFSYSFNLSPNLFRKEYFGSIFYTLFAFTLAGAERVQLLRGENCYGSQLYMQLYLVDPGTGCASQMVFPDFRD